MNIKEARMAAGLTQKKLSELTEIPLPTIKDWERGARDLSGWKERLVIEEIQRIRDREEKAENINSKEFYSLELDTAWYEKFADNFKRDYDRDPIPKNAEELAEAFTQASEKEKVIIINCLAGRSFFKGEIRLVKENYEVGETIVDYSREGVIAEFGVDEKGLNFMFAKKDELTEKTDRMKFYLDRMHVECDGEGIIVEFRARHIDSNCLFLID